MPYPTLIVESAYQESWPDVLKDMADWLGRHTNVQVVVVIKIYRPLPGDDPLLIRMEAAVFKRGPNNVPMATTGIVQFGTAGRTSSAPPPGVTKPGQSTLHIPFAPLWLSSNSIIMQGSNADWLQNELIIDLFEVQQAVLRVSP